MTLVVVRGRFRLVGGEPDGDSVRFAPDDPGVFARAGIAARVGTGGSTQLRLDAIDALETHYAPPAGGGHVVHQPLRYAHDARDALVGLLGFTRVQRRGEAVTASTPLETTGYILTRFADTYGRPVALVYPGEPAEPDGRAVHVTPEHLRGSLNHQLLADGLAYPTYYSKLYADLRTTLTQAVAQARGTGRGLWPGDATNRGVAVEAGDTLTDHAVILPKLFRRLIDYLALGHGDLSLDAFAAFLTTRDDRLFVISEGRLTGLDSLVQVTGQSLRLTHPPEDLVFVEA